MSAEVSGPVSLGLPRAGEPLTLADGNVNAALAAQLARGLLPAAFLNLAYGYDAGGAGNAAAGAVPAQVDNYRLTLPHGEVDLLYREETLAVNALVLAGGQPVYGSDLRRLAGDHLAGRKMTMFLSWLQRQLNEAAGEEVVTCRNGRYGVSGVYFRDGPHRRLLMPEYGTALPHLVRQALGVRAVAGVAAIVGADTSVGAGKAGNAEPAERPKHPDETAAVPDILASGLPPAAFMNRRTVGPGRLDSLVLRDSHTVVFDGVVHELSVEEGALLSLLGRIRGVGVVTVRTIEAVQVFGSGADAVTNVSAAMRSLAEKLTTASGRRMIVPVSGSGGEPGFQMAASLQIMDEPGRRQAGNSFAAAQARVLKAVHGTLLLPDNNRATTAAAAAGQSATTGQEHLTGDWRHHALCTDEDPELFFPVGTNGPALLRIAEAKTVCSACPVRPECLSYALGSGQNDGVWGGKAEDERRALRRLNARARARTA